MTFASGVCFQDAKPKEFKEGEERDRPGEEGETNLFTKNCKLHFLEAGEWKVMGNGTAARC